MRCKNSQGKNIVRFFASVALLGFALVAGAAGTVVGGGSTFPTYGYTGQRQPPTSPLVVGAPLVPATGSLFGVYAANSGNPVTYCPTGSTAGKRILAANVPWVETGSGLCLGSGPAGFNATGGPAITQAQFAASEAPLSFREFNSYRNGHGGSLPEQFPAIAGAIAISFTKSGIATLTLSEAQICAIFSGQVTHWEDPALATAGGVPSGITGPITIVYRSDGSGTSFSFLNHLSAVCPLAANTLPGKAPATEFKTVQDFSGGSAGGAWPYFLAYIAPVGRVGNGDVLDYIKSNDGTLGYVDAAYAVAGLAHMAFVKNTNTGAAVNPSTGFGAAAIPVTLTFNKVIADATDEHGRPALVDSPSATPCVAVVDPSSYANPATGYPILAMSYLLANQAGNLTDAGAIRSLLGTPYKNAPNRTSVTKIGRITTGYAWLSDASVLDSTDPATGIQARINSCIN